MHYNESDHQKATTSQEHIVSMSVTYTMLATMVQAWHML